MAPSQGYKNYNKGQPGRSRGSQAAGGTIRPGRKAGRKAGSRACSRAGSRAESRAGSRAGSSTPTRAPGYQEIPGLV